MANVYVSIDAAPDQTAENQPSKLDQRVITGQNLNQQKSTAKFFSSSETASESENISHSSLKLVQTARPVDVTAESDYLKYLAFFPPNLKEDNNDILIICATEDIKAADDFKKHLEKDIVLYVKSKPFRPRVKLLESYDAGSSYEYLDLAFEKTLYVFLYVTKYFCDCTWTLLQGQACLVEAIRDPDKKWCVIPVHTKSRKNQNYKLPMMLGSLRPINYWAENVDQFYTESVRRLIDSKLNLIMQRNIDLNKRRVEYFRQNKDSLFEKYAEFHCKTYSTHLSCSITAQEDSKPSDYFLHQNISQGISSRLQQINLSDSSTDKETAQCNVQPFMGYEEFENQPRIQLESNASSSFREKSNAHSFSKTNCISTLSQNSDSGVSSPLESMTNSITVDGPTSMTACETIQSTCTDCGTISIQSKPSYTFCSSIPPLSSHIMGADGVLYAQTPFGYQPVLPVMHTSNPNVNQSMVYSMNPYISIPFEPTSQSTQTSLNSSVQPNVSNTQSYQQLLSLTSASGIYPPLYPGYYMPHFPALASGQASSFPYHYAVPTYPAQFIPQDRQTLSNLSDQKQTLSNLSDQKQTLSNLSDQKQTLSNLSDQKQTLSNLSDQKQTLSNLSDQKQTVHNSSDQKQTVHNSTDQKASLDAHNIQMDSSGDAKKVSESSGSVQHIHHHYHHKKEIRIGNATNLVIGDKSKFISTVGSSSACEAFTNLSDTSSEDEVIDNIVVESSGSQTKEDISRHIQSVPSADCNHDLFTIKSPVESMGFPECPEPCSDRQPSKHSEDETYYNNVVLTQRKIV